VLVPVEIDNFDFEAPVTAAESHWWDIDRNNKLSDDERDEDGDGLSNYDEAHGQAQPSFWAGCYDREKPYPVAYAGTSLVDGDTDGDGVLDGADDQDHDDLPNLMELSRHAAAPEHAVNGGCANAQGLPSPTPERGFVNPFNPCLPYKDSRTCVRHPRFDAMPAPFDSGTPIYYVLN
jgi:hypothetical protein